MNEILAILLLSGICAAQTTLLNSGNGNTNDYVVPLNVYQQNGQAATGTLTFCYYNHTATWTTRTARSNHSPTWRR